MNGLLLEMAPDMTQPEYTFDLQKKRYDLGTFWPDPKKFFWSEEKNLGVLGEIFKTLT